MKELHQILKEGMFDDDFGVKMTELSFDQAAELYAFKVSYMDQVGIRTNTTKYKIIINNGEAKIPIGIEIGNSFLEFIKDYNITKLNVNGSLILSFDKKTIGNLIFDAVKIVVNSLKNVQKYDNCEFKATENCVYGSNVEFVNCDGSSQKLVLKLDLHPKSSLIKSKGTTFTAQHMIITPRSRTYPFEKYQEIFKDAGMELVNKGRIIDCVVENKKLIGKFGATDHIWNIKRLKIDTQSKVDDEGNAAILKLSIKV